MNYSISPKIKASIPRRSLYFYLKLESYIDLKYLYWVKYVKILKLVDKCDNKIIIYDIIMTIKINVRTRSEIDGF